LYYTVVYQNHCNRVVPKCAPVVGANVWCPCGQTLLAPALKLWLPFDIVMYNPLIRTLLSDRVEDITCAHVGATLLKVIYFIQDTLQFIQVCCCFTPFFLGTCNKCELFSSARWLFYNAI
jgi:hypothetical protein